MAKEKVYSEVLNLRIDETMSSEIKRIAGLDSNQDSETARALIEWGIAAHRAREVAVLSLPYGQAQPDDRYGRPMYLRIAAEWVAIDVDEL